MTILSRPRGGKLPLSSVVLLSRRGNSVLVGSLSLALLLLGGCLSASALSSEWLIAVDGDVTAATAALDSAAVESGGVVLSPPSATGSSYAFGDTVVGFRVQGTEAALFVSTSTSAAGLKSHAQRRMETLARRIVARASETSHLALRLRRASESAVASSLPRGEPPPTEPAIETDNPRMNKFAAYLHQVAETVQREFDRVMDSSKVYPPPGTFVKVKFLLLPDGRVGQILDVDNHTTDHGMKAALSAITNPAPFPRWSEAMKATLNSNGEEVAFTFYYQ